MMITTRLFEPDTDRYSFDFDTCAASKGWAQVDTDQDASYFGNWANPFTLQTVSYAEGDICVHKADNAKEFAEEMIRTQLWHQDYGDWRGIDTMCSPRIEQAFVYLGLGQLFHRGNRA